MSELSTPTTCELCGKVFYGPAIALGGQLQAGQMTPPRMMHFLKELFEHQANRHQREFQVTQARTYEFQGWLILSRYSTTDEAVLQQRDFCRWMIHQQTMQATAANLDIRAKEVATEFIEAKATAIADMVKLERTDDKLPKEIETIVAELKDDLAGAIEDVLNELREILEEPDKYIPARPTTTAN